MFAKLIRKASKILFSLQVIVFSCAFDAVDIVFKNINLVPDPIDKTDRYPHLPKSYVDEKSEKIGKQFKFPTIKSEKVADPVVSVNKTIKNIISPSIISIDHYIPDMEGIDYMFNLTNIGIIKKDKKGKDSGIDFRPSYLEKETGKLPIINDLPGMSQLYNKKTPIVKSIKDIQIPGLDDVLPTSVGTPLKPKDYDIQPHLDFFDDYTTPDKVLNTNIIDTIP